MILCLSYEQVPPPLINIDIRDKYDISNNGLAALFDDDTTLLSTLSGSYYLL